VSARHPSPFASIARRAPPGGLLAILVLAAGAAAAQPVDRAVTSTAAPGAAKAAAAHDVARPAGAVAKPTPPPEDPSDHDRLVGRLGFGWLGASQIPLASLRTFVLAPVLGCRYWVTPTIGVDAGLGIGVAVGGDHDGEVAAMLHGGLPLALYSGRHYTFLITPELNAGFASAPGGRAGFRVDVGARAGAELYFGFIGVPELALEASAGVFATVRGARSFGVSLPYDTAFELSTTSVNDPWDFFRSAVAARYYF
jgi:hypothetical protein